MSVFETTANWKTALNSWRGIHDKPSKENSAFHHGIQVMSNPLMEKYLTTAHWTLPGLWSLPLIGLMLYRSIVTEDRSAQEISLLFLAGAIGWTLVEYWLHRWIFHIKPSAHPLLRSIQFTIHGYHHEFPEDPRRLVAPPVLAVPVGISLAVAIWLCFPDHWPPLLAGTFFGYLCYDWMHYYAHHGRPKSGARKFMRRFHLHHHYCCAVVNFGLSSPLWDFVFGTFHDTRPNK